MTRHQIACHDAGYNVDKWRKLVENFRKELTELGIADSFEWEVEDNICHVSTTTQENH